MFVDLDTPPAASGVRVALQASPGSVTAARRAVRPIAAFSGADVHAVAVCVSEAVANVVFHAYRDQPVGQVRVTADIVDDLLEVSVEDDGLGLTPRPDSPGLGLGLALINAWSDELEIEAMAPGSRLVMRFALDEQIR